MKTRELLTSFFYLLTRGTPGSRGVPWGEVNVVIDEAIKGTRLTAVYTSDGGRLLAEGMTERLLGAEPASELEAGDADETHYRCECCTQTIAHSRGPSPLPEGFPKGRPITPPYFSARRCNDTGRGVVLCEPCATFVDSLDSPGVA